MIIILLVTLAILGIAYFQVIQGIFSALVMAILSLLSAALAFALYEPLAQYLYPYLSGTSEGAALIGIFAATLIVSRMAFDYLIPGNVVIGLWVDRIGGGLLGILSGMIMVGMITIAMQMFPFDAKMLTYEPFDSTLQRQQSLSPFVPDEFTLGLVNTLSAGSLADKQELGKIHDDLLKEAFCSRNTAGLFGSVEAKTDSLTSVAVHIPPTNSPWEENIPQNPMIPTGEMDKYLVVRCALNESAADPEDKKNKKPARWALPATHFRLTTNAGKNYYPMAYLTYKDGKWEAEAAPLEEGDPMRPERAKLAVKRPIETGKTLTVDWVYRIPQSEEPAYLTFRQISKRNITGIKEGVMPSPDKALNRKEGRR
jgi:uncharacterized membrane protein required for colicin V production